MQCINWVFPTGCRIPKNQIAECMVAVNLRFRYCFKKSYREGGVWWYLLICFAKPNHNWNFLLSFGYWRYLIAEKDYGMNKLASKQHWTRLNNWHNIENQQLGSFLIDKNFVKSVKMELHNCSDCTLVIDNASDFVVCKFLVMPYVLTTLLFSENEKKPFFTEIPVMMYKSNFHTMNYVMTWDLSHLLTFTCSWLHFFTTSNFTEL